MELSKWFEYQLRSTLDGFIWAVQQLPKERLYALPPTSLGEWSASQHLLHMLEYEQNLALPSMHQWLGTPPAVRKEGDENEKRNSPTIEEMLTQFEQVRQAEIALLSKFDDETWNSNRNTTFWGEVSLFWLVSKTYQHTLEHTHDILRLALFWDRILKRTAK
jgi:uncharacterized damage-inducible protein DinB